MVEIISLNNRYATTKLCHKLISNEYFNDEKKLDPAKKSKIDISLYNIKNSCIYAEKDEKFDTLLFLSDRDDGRQGEGGLRTRGFFKHGYKKSGKYWYTVDSHGKSVEVVKDGMPNIASENLPLISIVTIVYNGADEIDKTIQSVLNQRYPNVEYIVIDGGSTDGTVEVIKKYDEFLDYWISEKDRGISDAFNKGISLVWGEFVLILNAGDSFLSPEILENVADDFVPKAIISYQVQTPYGNRFPLDYRYVETQKAHIPDIVHNALVAHQAAFVPLALYRQVGLYRLEYKIRMDFEFFLRATRKSKVLFIPKPIVLYQTNGISSKLKNRLQFKLEERKAIVSQCGEDIFYEISFWLNLPFYLIKKTLSALKYQIKDRVSG